MPKASDADTLSGVIFPESHRATSFGMLDS